MRATTLARMLKLTLSRISAAKGAMEGWMEEQKSKKGGGSRLFMTMRKKRSLDR